MVRQLWAGVLITIGLSSCQLAGGGSGSGSLSPRVRITTNGQPPIVAGYSDSLQLTATDKSGRAFDAKDVVWSVTAIGGIGGVDRGGVVTGAGNGIIEVVAHLDGVGDSLPFQVSIQDTSPILITGGYYRQSNDSSGLFYFFNGSYHELQAPDGIGWASELYGGDLRNGRVIVAGQVWKATSAGSSFCYWDNDVIHEISDADSVKQVVLDGDSFYILGTSGGKPCYWKDGVRVDLACPDGYLSFPGNSVPPGTKSTPLALSINNGTVIASGIVYKDSFPTYPEFACIWTNGVPQVFDSPEGYKVTALGFSSGETLAIATAGIATTVFSDDAWTPLAVLADVPDNLTYSGVEVFKKSGQLFVTGDAYWNGHNACVWIDNVPYVLENGGNHTASAGSVVPGNSLLTVGAQYDLLGNPQSARFWYDGAAVPLANMVTADRSWYSHISVDSAGPTASANRVPVLRPRRL